MSDQPLVLLVVGFLLTSGLGGAFAYVFQQRAWRHQYEAQRDDHLREQALKTFEEVSTLLDQRLYRMRRVYWAAKRRARTSTDNAELNAELADYRAVLRLWNDNLNRILALVDTYFGEAARRALEHELYEAYASVGEELDEFVREVSARGDDPVGIRAIGVRLSELSREVYQFNVALLHSLRDARLGKNAPTILMGAGQGEPVLVRFGDKGESVRLLQTALQRLGAALVVDGHFGRSTERALREFQRSNGLTANGVANAESLEALSKTGPSQ